MSRRLSAFFFLSFPIALKATCFSPWFGNVFEFEARTTYGYDRIQKIQTPEGSFTNIRNNHHLDFSLALSPWPDWDIETELYFSHSPDIEFAYEAFLFTARYLLLDDVTGDPFSLAIGATCSVPGDRFMRDLGYVYHGHVNGEYHVSIGKECPNFCTGTWNSRYWALAGFGTSDKGSPWVHAIAEAEWNFGCPQMCIFSEFLAGLGHENIDPFTPFDGYATIAHRSLDIGGCISYMYPYLGSLTVEGFYNVYAHNFPEHFFGMRLTLLIPFSL